MNQRENRRSVAIAQESQQKYIQGQSAMLILFVFLFFSFFFCLFFVFLNVTVCLHVVCLSLMSVQQAPVPVCVCVFKMVCAWLHVCLFVNLSSLVVFTPCVHASAVGAYRL